MVMKRNVMRKNLLQTIRRSIGRYIAIVAIIALGAGMFVGLVTTKTDMIATVQEYTRDQNMFHLRLLNTYGWSQTELDKIAALSTVADAEGSVSLDVIAHFNEDGEDLVYRLHTVPERISKVYLLGGRMPQREDECLADGSHADDSVLGTQVFISEENQQETLDNLVVKTFTVVGYVSTPLYMDITRGTTTIGNGSLSSYIYVPSEALTVDYYTEINVTLDSEYEAYSDELTQQMEDTAVEIEPDLIELANQRYDTLKQDARQEYEDGLAEYEDGLSDYEEGRAEAEKQLLDALHQLKNGQTEIDANRLKLLEGEKQLADGTAALEQKTLDLHAARQELSDTRAETYQQLADAYDELMSNYKTALDGQRQLEDGLKQLEDGIAQLESGLEEAASGLQQLELVIGVYETTIEATERLIEAEKDSLVVNLDRIAKLEEELAGQKEKLQEYADQKQEVLAAQEEYAPKLSELKEQKQTLLEQKKTVDAGVAQMELGFKELEAKQLQADNGFEAAQLQIAAGELQLEDGRKELEKQAAQLELAKAELEAAERTLMDGWSEYANGKAETDLKLGDANQKLTDAKRQLDDANEAIASMTAPEVFILDRNTNTGYMAVNRNSDIVAGVSKVFPAFFLFIAALVCITTLTKMVDEERTQIGVLKALGYSGSAIARKYLLYCGSAAVVGCGLGVVIGSIVFPKILWFAYGIILCIRPNVALKLDIPLCLAVIGAYTAVSMAVTWFCCRRELREVPAQLIRPKAPAAGKKILLEHLPFWNRIGFLNKVMFRNVFRYRQRLLMMLVGIGGCTALLLTGFGIGDSIGDIVDYQFAEVTVYDMEVYFSKGQDPQQQKAFREEVRGYVDQMHFYHRSSVELEHEDLTKTVTLISTEQDLSPYLDLHHGDVPLANPKAGEALVSVGAAEYLGLDVGDEIRLHNSDMKYISVSITGIYDNHVNDYLIIHPDTIVQQWGQQPQQQMAMLNIRENGDIHAAGAEIAAMEGVMAVSINQDIAEQVGGMLEALNLVVLTVVICAGLLAMIVLYNLTNISISERIREIATIKVLGFQPREAAAYVFKENLLLSAMGAAIGLGGGILLLRFVMSQIKVDMVWFQARLTWSSYVLAFVLTMVFAAIVDFILYFKLEKINMAEALKSVE